MTQPDYKQKRRECWEEFKRTNLDGEVHWQPVSRYEVFSYAFDRAYALGRQTESITQEEIEKAAVEYAASLSECGMYDKETPATKEDMEYAFKAGVNFALGKQEKDADTVIQGWVARASDGHLALFKRKPDREIYRRSNNNGLWFGGSMTELDSELFPDLTWDDDPEPVEIIIKRKKK